MEAGNVRKILGDDKIIGVSAQTVEQALLAQKHGADYLRSEQFSKQAQRTMQMMFHTMNFRKSVRLLTFL